MVYEGKVRKIGNSRGIILPVELCAELGIALGDKVYMENVLNSITIHTEMPDAPMRFGAARDIDVPEEWFDDELESRVAELFEGGM